MSSGIAPQSEGRIRVFTILISAPQQVLHTQIEFVIDQVTPCVFEGAGSN